MNNYSKLVTTIAIFVSLVSIFAYYEVEKSRQFRSALLNATSLPAFDVSIETPINPDELECLAKTIYFEARGENLAGQFAVAEVVLERKESADFPSTICGVVKEARRPGRYNCQFTWWCDGKSDHPLDNQAYTLSQLVSALSMLRLTSEFVDDATHYHADYVSPDWAIGRQLVTQIGKHYFYQ